MAASSDVWVLVEHRDGKPEPPSLEAVSAARSLADQLEADVAALAVDGPPPDASAWSAVGEAGADTLVLARSRPAVGRSAAAGADVVASVLGERGVAALVAAGTDPGSDIAARVATRLGLALVEDCVSWRVEPEVLAAYLPGPDNRHAIRVHADRAAGAVLIVPVGTLEARAACGPVGETVVLDIDQQPDAGDPELIDVAPEDRRGVPLEHADVIVAGGRGLGGAAGFEILERLAEVLGGTVGASRMVTDLGWAARDRLVGQTGKIVRPRLYVACGISGASQHLAGMRESGTIVAINIDSSAPIAAVADVMAVGDVGEVVPALIDALEDGAG